MVEGEEQNNAADRLSISTLKPQCWGFFDACERHLNVHPASLSRSRSVKTDQLPELVSLGHQSTASSLRFQCDFLWTRASVTRKCLPNDFRTRLCSSSLARCSVEGAGVDAERRPIFTVVGRCQLVVVLVCTPSSSSICQFFRSKRVSRRWI